MDFLLQYLLNTIKSYCQITEHCITGYTLANALFRNSETALPPLLCSLNPNCLLLIMLYEFIYSRTYFLLFFFYFVNFDLKSDGSFRANTFIQLYYNAERK